MLTYRCGNITQDDAAVGDSGGSGFGSPALETNGAQPTNTNDDGANASRTLLLGRAVNPGLTMAVAGLQVTVQGIVGSVTLIGSLTNNTGVPVITTQGVQLTSTPPTQRLQRPAGAVVVPMSAAPPKGAVAAKLLAMHDAQTKEELEGQQESKAQESVIQGAVVIMIEPIILGCVFGKSLTIKSVHPASRVLPSMAMWICSKRESSSRISREVLNTSADNLTGKLVRVKNEERGQCQCGF